MNLIESFTVKNLGQKSKMLIKYGVPGIVVSPEFKGGGIFPPPFLSEIYPPAKLADTPAKFSLAFYILTSIILTSITWGRYGIRKQGKRTDLS